MPLHHVEEGFGVEAAEDGRHPFQEVQVDGLGLGVQVLGGGPQGLGGAASFSASGPSSGSASSDSVGTSFRRSASSAVLWAILKIQELNLNSGL